MGYAPLGWRYDSAIIWRMPVVSVRTSETQEVNVSYMVGVLTLHGMGTQEEGYSASWKTNIRRRLVPSVSPHVAFGEVYYQRIMQYQQTKLWDERLGWEIRSLLPLKLVFLLVVSAWIAAIAVAALGLVDSLVLASGLTAITAATLWSAVILSDRVWVRIRQFLLYAFSDPATYAHKAGEPGSIYQQVHDEITAKLRGLCAGLDPDGRVVVVAHSLGAHVLSNYIWDAQQPLRVGDAAAQAALLESEDYRCIQKIARVFTAAPNITFFVAGLPEVQPFAKPSTDFEWHSFYDKDDVLGWQLIPLPPGAHSSYADLVTIEQRINVGSLWTSWNPLSHTKYLGQGTAFVKHVADEIGKLHVEIASPPPPP